MCFGAIESLNIKVSITLIELDFIIYGNWKKKWDVRTAHPNANPILLKTWPGPIKRQTSADKVPLPFDFLLIFDQSAVPSITRKTTPQHSHSGVNKFIIFSLMIFLYKWVIKNAGRIGCYFK